MYKLLQNVRKVTESLNDDGRREASGHGVSDGERRTSFQRTNNFPSPVHAPSHRPESRVGRGRRAASYASRRIRGTPCWSVLFLHQFFMRSGSCCCQDNSSVTHQLRWKTIIMRKRDKNYKKHAA